MISTSPVSSLPANRDAPGSVLALVVRITAWIVLLYLGMLAVTLAFDTITARRHKTLSLFRDYPLSIHANTAHYAVYGLDRLDNYPRQVFILGGSAPGQAFDPEQIMRGLPGYKVHNLCVIVSNMTQVEQMLTLLSAHVDWEHLTSAVFVIGGHFGSFIDNNRRFDGLTEIDIEKLRHHLYRNDGGGVRPVLGPGAMPLAFFLIKPFGFVHKLTVEGSILVNESLGTLVGLLRETVSEPVRRDAAFYRAQRTKQFRDSELTDDQFDLFLGLVKRLHSGGARIVLVDMPVPSFLREGFPVYADYRVREARIVRDSRVHYLDLTSFAPDEQFRDDAHPRPEFAAAWTQALLDFLKGPALTSSP